MVKRLSDLKLLQQSAKRLPWKKCESECKLHGRLDGGKRVLVHLIEAEDLIRGISWWSRLNADWAFLIHLHDIGRARAEEWLDANFDRIGVESTVDLQGKYF
jgi:hypothetical protein